MTAHAGGQTVRTRDSLAGALMVRDSLAGALMVRDSFTGALIRPPSEVVQHLAMGTAARSAGIYERT